MEWFFGPKGLKFSEIGCRPPGVRAWDLYAAGNDIDIYREWAMADRARPAEPDAVAPLRRGHHRAAPRPRRRDHRLRRLDEIQRRFGEWIIDAHLPPPGTPTQPVEAGYMANAWVRMKHPDYDTLRGMLDAVGRTPEGPRSIV